MTTSATIEKIRALLPDAVAVLAFADALPRPVDPVVDAYIQDHVGFWRFEVGSALGMGTARQRQEDGVFVDPVGCAFAVLDGMGGQGTGAWATDLVREVLEESFPHPKQARERRSTVKDCPMVAALERGNTTIQDKCEQSSVSALGACCAGVYIDGTSMNVAHVGNCRAYRFRGAALELLTEDHSFVNDFKKTPAYQESLSSMAGLSRERIAERLGRYKNIITHSIGFEEHIDVEWSRHTLESEDLILLCSDGLWYAVSDASMASILCQTASLPVQARCRALLDAALGARTDDNVGIVLVEISA